MCIRDSNNLSLFIVAFTKPTVIFQDSVDKIRDTVARPSLDTFFEVDFAFSNWDKWLGIF